MLFEQRSSAVGDLSDANADTALRKTAEGSKQDIPTNGSAPSPVARSPPTAPLVASELLCATAAVTSESALSLTTERASSGCATAATAGSIGTHGSVPIAVARVSTQRQQQPIVCLPMAETQCTAGSSTSREGERGRLSLLSVESMPMADANDILATHHHLLGLEKASRTAATAVTVIGPRRSFRPISASGAGVGTSSGSTTTGSGVLADGSDRQQSFASSSFGLQQQQQQRGGGSVRSVPSAFAALPAGGTAGAGGVPPPLALAGSGHSHHHSGLPRMGGNPFSPEPSSSGTAATLVASDGAATMVSASASSQMADRPHLAQSPEVPSGGVSSSTRKERCAEDGLDASDSTCRNATATFGAFFTSFNPPSTLDSRMGVPHAPRWAGSGASVMSSAAATGAAMAAGKESPVHHPYGFANMPHVLGRSPIGSSSHNLAAVGGHGLGPSPRHRRSGGGAVGGGADLRLLDGFRYGIEEAEGDAPQFLGRSDSGAAHGIGATTGTLLGMSEPKVVEADFRYSPESGGYVGGIVGISGSPSAVPPGISAGSLHHVGGVGGFGLAPSGGLHPNVSASPSVSASASASAAAAAAQEHFQFGLGLSQGFGAMLCSNTEGAEVSATCTEEEGGLLIGRLRRQPHGSASVVSATTLTANEQSTISQASTSPSRHERPTASSAPTTTGGGSAYLWPEEGALRRQFTQQPSESEAARHQPQHQSAAPEAGRKGPSRVAVAAIPSLAAGHGLGNNGYTHAKPYAGRHRSADEKRFTAVFGTRSGTAAASLSPATAMHSGAATGTPTALSGRARASGGSLTLMGASGVGLTPSQQSVLAFHAQQTMLSQGSHSLQAAGDANSNSATIGVGTVGHSPHTPSGGVQQQLLTRLANADSGFGAGVAGGGRFSPASASTNNGLLGNDKASVATAAPNSALFSPNHPRTTPPHRHSTAASSS